MQLRGFKFLSNTGFCFRPWRCCLNILLEGGEAFANSPLSFFDRRAVQPVKTSSPLRANLSETLVLS
jgi:hypothetical protein